MRAIMVSVDYADLLDITLPYNRHHFEEVMVVTSPDGHADHKTAAKHGARVFTSAAFYDDRADFNKWKALELGLDAFGRKGWLCLMDADVLWPKNATDNLTLIKSNLYTPRRRMLEGWPDEPVPDKEADWVNYRIHPQEREFAGYSQIFHADDQHLPEPPWHETNWMHAGGADSFFQALWPEVFKVRPPFEVLHLGKAGVNWCGRATTYADGTKPEKGDQRFAQARRYRHGRYACHKRTGDWYANEKIKPTEP